MPHFMWNLEYYVDLEYGWCGSLVKGHDAFIPHDLCEAVNKSIVWCDFAKFYPCLLKSLYLDTISSSILSDIHCIGVLVCAIYTEVFT